MFDFKQLLVNSGTIVQWAGLQLKKIIDNDWRHTFVEKLCKDIYSVENFLVEENGYSRVWSWPSGFFGSFPKGRGQILFGGFFRKGGGGGFPPIRQKFSSKNILRKGGEGGTLAHFPAVFFHISHWYLGAGEPPWRIRQKTISAKWVVPHWRTNSFCSLFQSSGPLLSLYRGSFRH